MDEQATAVLLSFDRLCNLQEIVDNLLSQPFVAEVVVWNNSPREDLRWLDAERVTVWTSGCNLYTWGRFVAARYCARHAWIVTQDDDYMIGNWPEIWAAREDSRITAALDQTHRNIHDKRSRWGRCHEVLLGWGSVFRRDLIPLALHPYIALHGIDQPLLRKADRPRDRPAATSQGRPDIQHHAWLRAPDRGRTGNAIAWGGRKDGLVSSRGPPQPDSDCQGERP